MKKLFDLRFVIGTFFFVVGILLIAYALIEKEGQKVNLICGGIFTLFGLIMILFSSFAKKEDVATEAQKH